MLLVDVSDTLAINAASNQPGEKVITNFRFIQGNQIYADQLKLDLSAGDRSVVPAYYPMDRVFSRGKCSDRMYLSDISIEAAIATGRGQTFARANLYRKGINGGSTKCSILSDYVSKTVTACLRNSRHFVSTEGQGWIHTFTTAASANQNWSVTVPNNAIWRIIAVFFELTTGPTVGNRFPAVILTDGVTQFWQASDPLGVPASTVRLYNCSAALTPNSIASGSDYIPLPFSPIIRAGSVISSNVNFLDPADQFLFIALLIEEWIDQV